MFFFAVEKGLLSRPWRMLCIISWTTKFVPPQQYPLEHNVSLARIVQTGYWMATVRYSILLAGESSFSINHCHNTLDVMGIFRELTEHSTETKKIALYISLSFNKEKNCISHDPPSPSTYKVSTAQQSQTWEQSYVICWQSVLNSFWVM